MDYPEHLAQVTIEIPCPLDDVRFDEALSDLFDSIADLVFAWAEDKNVDPLMLADFNKPIPKRFAKTNTPLQDPLACEADSESNQRRQRSLERGLEGEHRG